MSGNSKKAEIYYQKALLVKKDPGILVKLGLLNEKSQKFEKAEEYYEELIKHFPELFIGYNQLAWLYAKQGIELDKAMDLAEKANKAGPDNPSILYHLGVVHNTLKEYDITKKYLEKALGISKNFDEFKKAQKLYDKLN